MTGLEGGAWSPVRSVACAAIFPPTVPLCPLCGIPLEVISFCSIDRLARARAGRLRCDDAAVASAEDAGRGGEEQLVGGGSAASAASAVGAVSCII